MTMSGAVGSISARGREAYAHFETLSARGARVMCFTATPTRVWKSLRYVLVRMPDACAPSPAFA